MSLLKNVTTQRTAVAKSALEFAFNDKRVRPMTINAKIPTKCDAVLYWMSRDQRVQDNWALLYAQRLALQLKAKLYVAFCLVPTFHEATIRHYTFLLEGLKEVEEECSKLSIPFDLILGSAPQRLPTFVRERSVDVVVTDFAPLRTPLEWVKNVANELPTNVPLLQVDAHNVVPCWIASPKEEIGARTLRPKIHKLFPEFLTEFPPVVSHAEFNSKILAATNRVDWALAYASLQVDQTVLPIKWAKPGTAAGFATLNDFITTRLRNYMQQRNDPNKECQSQLSPWFHYGQISVQRCVLEVLKHKKNAKESVDAFVEEAVIRRELSDNFCYNNKNYDSVEGAANWARESLTKHTADKRVEAYTAEEIEAGRTYDDLWNAAHMQLRHDGKMHGYMRMYWAKKILEWTPTPADALKLAIYLNDRYSIDGRDPNGYVGCMWSICGVHDQGWREREIFGKIRYMNSAGCHRKFDVEAYVAKFRQYIPPRKRPVELAATAAATAAASGSTSYQSTLTKTGAVKKLKRA